MNIRRISTENFNDKHCVRLNGFDWYGIDIDESISSKEIEDIHIFVNDRVFNYISKRGREIYNTLYNRSLKTITFFDGEFIFRGTSITSPNEAYFCITSKLPSINLTARVTPKMSPALPLSTHNNFLSVVEQIHFYDPKIQGDFEFLVKNNNTVASAIVFLFLDEKNTVTDCVDNYFIQKYNSETDEAILIDGGSNDTITVHNKIKYKVPIHSHDIYFIPFFDTATSEGISFSKNSTSVVSSYSGDFILSVKLNKSFARMYLLLVTVDTADYVLGKVCRSVYYENEPIPPKTVFSQKTLNTSRV